VTSTRTAVSVAVAALVLGVLLIGGSGSFALWNAQKTGTALNFTSGTLTASVAAPTMATTSLGSAPSGVVVRSGSVGLIPGIQGQTVTYVITNTGSARAPAKITVNTKATVQAGATTQWGIIQPYLSASFTVNGGASTAIPASNITASGIDDTHTTTVVLQPQSTATIVFSFSLPATSGGNDLTRTLQAARSTTTSINQLLVFAPVFRLDQVPRAA